MNAPVRLIRRRDASAITQIDRAPILLRMPSPNDRSHIDTEQRNPRSTNLHEMNVRECVRLIQSEDRAVIGAMEAASDSIVRFIEAAEPGFVGGGRLIYIGAGTSGRLGVLDASEAPPTFQVDAGRIIGIIAGGDAALRRSSEGLEDDPDGATDLLRQLIPNERDAVIGIAAGGTTPFVLGALRKAKELSAARGGETLTCLLTCTALVRPPFADHLIVLETGPEVLTGSTRMKAGTATKLALNTISTTLMVCSGKVYENLMVDVRATNDKLRDRAARIVGVLTGLPREACFELLDRAGGAVKTAVVMEKLRLDRARSEERLAACGGRLDRALGE